jgi:hypothetical protein
MENPLWDLEQITIQYNQKIDRYGYLFTDYDYQEVTYTFDVRRKPLYFMINGIFPCLVLNLLTLLSFFLPTAPQLTISE